MMELSIDTAESEFLKELENPRSIHDEIKYQKDNFSKLKFQYLEQETRDKFLRNLLNNDINGLTNNEELVKRQQENSEIKAQLKQLKKAMANKQQDINTITETVLQHYHEYQSQLHQNNQLLTDIDDIEAKINDIDKQMDFDFDVIDFEGDKVTAPDEITEVSDYVSYFHQQLDHTHQVESQVAGELHQKTQTLDEKQKLVNILTEKLQELKDRIAKNQSGSDPVEGEYNNLGKWMLEINKVLSNFIDTTIDYQLTSQEFQLTINKQHKLVFDLKNFLLVANNFNLNQVNFNLNSDKFKALLEIIVNIDQYQLQDM